MKIYQEYAKMVNISPDEFSLLFENKNITIANILASRDDLPRYWTDYIITIPELLYTWLGNSSREMTNLDMLIKQNLDMTYLHRIAKQKNLSIKMVKYLLLRDDGIISKLILENYNNLEKHDPRNQTRRNIVESYIHNNSFGRNSVGEHFASLFSGKDWISVIKGAKLTDLGAISLSLGHAKQYPVISKIFIGKVKNNIEIIKDQDFDSQYLNKIVEQLINNIFFTTKEYNFLATIITDQDLSKKISYLISNDSLNSYNKIKSIYNDKKKCGDNCSHVKFIEFLIKNTSPYLYEFDVLLYNLLMHNMQNIDLISHLLKFADRSSLTNSITIYKNNLFFISSLCRIKGIDFIKDILDFKVLRILIDNGVIDVGENNIPEKFKKFFIHNYKPLSTLISNPIYIPYIIDEFKMIESEKQEFFSTLLYEWDGTLDDLVHAVNKL